MPTMKSTLHFKDERGEHDGRAASGASGGTRKQPGIVEKLEEGDEKKPAARQSEEGSDGEPEAPDGEPEASDSLREAAESIRASEEDLADFRAPDLGATKLLEAREVPGSIAMEIYLQDGGRGRVQLPLTDGVQNIFWWTDLHPHKVE